MKPSSSICRFLIASATPLNQAMFRKSATQRLCLTACAAAVISALTLVHSASGADVTWNGTTDMTWTQPDATSWSAAYNSGDNVTFTSTGAGTVTVSGTVNPGNFSITSGTTHAFTGGTLSANGTTFQIGANNSSTNVTANMSGLSSFVYNNTGGTFRVGLSAAGTSNLATTTLTLAASNTITAANLFIADVDASNTSPGNTGILHLGAANVINVNNINMGAGAAGRSSSTLDFAASNSNATFRGMNGTGAVATWKIGNISSNNTAANFTDTADFSNGTIDALVTTLTIGTADTGSQTSRIGVNNSFFNMGQGTLVVDTMTVGALLGTGSAHATSALRGNGTFTLNHADGLVQAGDIILGTKNNSLSGGGSNTTASGTFNLTAGTLEAETIGQGAQTGIGTTSRNFNFTGGTLRNAVGSNLAIDNVPINLTGSGSRFIEATTGRSITVGSNANISGSGQGFTKTGAGSLILDGTKTYSGNTIVSDGTLYVTGALSNSAVNVGANGAIGSNGANSNLGNGLTLAAGGALDLTNATLGSNSSGILSLTGGSLTLGNLTFQDLTGWDWLNAAEGTYELIDGTFTVDFGSTAFTSAETAYDFGNGRAGYFTNGGLNAVIIPEPSVALLGGLGVLVLLRRRRPA